MDIITKGAYKPISTQFGFFEIRDMMINIIYSNGF